MQSIEQAADDYASAVRWLNACYTERAAAVQKVHDAQRVAEERRVALLAAVEAGR